MDDVRKQGMLYFQQQRFGKKWKRVWCVLYRDSSCSISRLEFFDCKDGGVGMLDKSDKVLRKQQESKKVIRLSECIRVVELEMDGCPKDTSAFLLETTYKLYVFSAVREQLDDWIQKLCETAFPMSWRQRGGRVGQQTGSRVENEEERIEDNSLYSSRQTVLDITVSVRRTEASQRCGLRGVYVLRAGADSLLLLDHNTGEVQFIWPYHFLRRFGRDKTAFSFEAGRRCDSGEGCFEFETQQGNVLFQMVESAIHLQCTTNPVRQTSGGGHDSLDITHPQPSRSLPLPQTPAQTEDSVYSVVNDTPVLQLLQTREGDTSSTPQQSGLEPPVDKVLTGVKSLTLDTRGLPVPRKNQVKPISSCPLLSSNPKLEQTYSQVSPRRAPHRTGEREKGVRERGEPEYSLPFDTIAKNIMADIMNSHQATGFGKAQFSADPLYDSIDESQVRAVLRGVAKAPSKACSVAEHIYDEPEGCAAMGQKSATPTFLYDHPEEVKGNAWRRMGTTVDPKGHEYLYDPRVDDYAVPKPPRRITSVDNGTNEEEEDQQENEEEDCMECPYHNVMTKPTDTERR
ncbi:docking protein 2 [Lampris incognitus]|uniref:docking protein 2 n=1 Tax=Lampris incognitus TaxID=2546036 RepID=UPI0024B53B81|nr:docking protein 2 [Lampris incognitus]